MKWSAEDFANQVGAFRRQLAGIVRRMTISLTDGGTWQTVGHLLFGGDKETRDPEHYPGVGFYARPPAGSESAEAIVLQVAGQNQPAIVATRDEATRAKVTDIKADEAAVHNTQCRLYLKDDGTIEARTHDGAAVALAKLSEVSALRNYVNNQFSAVGGHLHAVSGAATTTITAVAVEGGTPPTVVPAVPTGTTKLKGE